jgi:hypothetical protein
MKSYFLMCGIVIIGSIILGMVMSQEFSIMLYAMLVLGTVFFGIVAART